MKNCAKRIITMLTVLFLAGCGKPTPPDKKRVQSVNIVEESVSLLVDETKALTCVILPEDAEDKEITWSSSNANVASVSETGLVTALAAGRTTITVISKDNLDLFDTCVVNVSAPEVKVSSILFDKESLNMYVDDEETIVATVLPEKADNKELSWSSQNTNIATVNQDGKVTAKAIGNTVITATACDESGVYKSIPVTVSRRVILVDSVTLSEDNIELLLGESANLTASVLPENADNKELEWIIDDESIISFENNVITPLKVGVTTITAKAKDGSNKSDSCQVTVSKYQAIEGSFTEQEETVISASNNSKALVMKNNYQSGYSFEVKMTANTDKKAGIIFGANKELSSYYLLAMNNYYGNQFRLFSYNTTDGYQLIKGCYVTAGYSKVAEITIKVIVSNSEIRCLFEGKEILYVKGVGALNNPYIGILSEASTSKFKNFSLSSQHAGVKVDTLVAGHSYAELWSNYKADLSEISSDLANIGIGGTASNDWVDHVAEIVDYEPNKLVFFMGINDIPRSTTVSDIVNNIKTTLNGVMTALPNIKICLLSTNKCPQYNSSDNITKIDNLNTELKKYISSLYQDGNDNIVYGNLDNAFLDVNGNPLSSAFADGLHPTADSYKHIASVVKKSFEDLETRKLDNKSTLIVGHSYMDYWKDTYRADLVKYKNINNIGIGGTSSNDWLLKTNDVIALNPDRLIYMIGINDIHHFINNGALYKNIKEFLVGVKASCPDMEVALLSINQVPLDYDKFVNQINDANTFIKRVAAEYDWINYGNLDNAFQNGYGRPNNNYFMEGDFGLHIKFGKYDTVANAIYQAFAKEGQPSSYKTSGIDLANDFKSGVMPGDWEINNDTIISNTNGFALSKKKYTDFMFTAVMDGVYEGADGDDFDHNPYFTHILTKGLVVGGSVSSNGNLKGYIISLTKNWIQIGYLDGVGVDGNPYKGGDILAAYNWDPNNIAITVRVIWNTLYIYNQFGEEKLSWKMNDYEGGSIGMFGTDGYSFTTTFLEYHDLTLVNDSIVSSMMEAGLPTGWSSTPNTITATTNGFALTKNSYNDVMFLAAMDGVYEGADGDDFDHNPFFTHILTKGLVVGGSVSSNGNLKGYIISLTKNWIQIGYLDGVGVDGNPYKGGDILASYNLDPNNLALLINISGTTITISKTNGETILSYEMTNYEGGSIGMFGTDGYSFTTGFMSNYTWPFMGREVFK